MRLTNRVAKAGNAAMLNREMMGLMYFREMILLFPSFRMKADTVPSAGKASWEETVWVGGSML